MQLQVLVMPRCGREQRDKMISSSFGDFLASGTLQFGDSAPYRVVGYEFYSLPSTPGRGKNVNAYVHLLATMDF